MEQYFRKYVDQAEFVQVLESDLPPPRLRPPPNLYPALVGVVTADYQLINEYCRTVFESRDRLNNIKERCNNDSHIQDDYHRVSYN